MKLSITVHLARQGGNETLFKQRDAKSDYEFILANSFIYSSHFLWGNTRKSLTSKRLFKVKKEKVKKAYSRINNNNSLFICFCFCFLSINVIIIIKTTFFFSFKREKLYTAKPFLTVSAAWQTGLWIIKFPFKAVINVQPLLITNRKKSFKLRQRIWMKWRWPNGITAVTLESVKRIQIQACVAFTSY